MSTSRSRQCRLLVEVDINGSPRLDLLLWSIGSQNAVYTGNYLGQDAASENSENRTIQGFRARRARGEAILLNLVWQGMLGEPSELELSPAVCSPARVVRDDLARSGPTVAAIGRV